MIIPIDMLDKKTLRSLIEEYVTRDGTEFSDTEKKIDSVVIQIKEGLAFIVFDEESQSCNILSKKQMSCD